VLTVTRIATRVLLLSASASGVIAEYLHLPAGRSCDAGERVSFFLALDGISRSSGVSSGEARGLAATRACLALLAASPIGFGLALRLSVSRDV